MRCKYQIEKQTDRFGRDYYSLLRFPVDGEVYGRNTGDYKSLREAKKAKKLKEETR